MPYKEFDLGTVGKVKIYKRRSNRSLRLTIGADGTPRVTIPIWTPYRVGAAFVLSKQNWITSHHRPASTLLEDGMRIGKSHHMRFRSSVELGSVKTNVGQTEITITHSHTVDSNDENVQTAAKAAALRALRRQAVSLLGQRLEQLANTHGLTYHGLSVKRMKRRWGSCDAGANIVLNLHLVQLPWEFIDYVILHELAHTKVLHHGPDFWAILEALEPRARTLRKAIKRYQPDLAFEATP